jgi:hypothetical protein
VANKYFSSIFYLPSSIFIRLAVSTFLRLIFAPILHVNNNFGNSLIEPKQGWFLPKSYGGRHNNVHAKDFSVDFSGHARCLPAGLQRANDCN